MIKSYEPAEYVQPVELAHVSLRPWLSSDEFKPKHAALIWVCFAASTGGPYAVQNGWKIREGRSLHGSIGSFYQTLVSGQPHTWTDWHLSEVYWMPRIEGEEAPEPPEDY